MARMTAERLRQTRRQAGEQARAGWTILRSRGPSQVQFWFLALLVGIGAGLAALLFRFGIETAEALLYGTDDVASLGTGSARLAWYWIVLIPLAGGLVVGQILHHFTPDGRVRTVADVIEGAALHEGRVERREGIASALSSLITLGTGGSSGREGPVVHLAAVIATAISRAINANGITGRELLGCAVAAAVSASFNAPLAGALFAMEVVLRHFAIHAFAPIAIASVAGTVINRMAFGNVTEYTLPNQTMLAFYVELPAYVLLGLVAGLVAFVLMRSIFWAEDLGDRLQTATRLPRYLRPALAGLMLGVLALQWPHIIGVGYQTTSDALTGNLSLGQAFTFAVLKIVAVAITMGGRMGGGVFSPALMVGALTGLTFGIIATGIFPNVSGDGSLYALAGMGAVAAAVLGAPISTALIVFELTGDWQTGLAVLVSVSIATAIASRLVDRSFFLTQLERRGVRLAAGPQSYLLSTVRVATVMRARGAPRAAPDESCEAMIREGLWIDSGATLERAMPLLEKTGSDFIPVARAGEGEPELWGALFHVDALRAFNRALAETAAEEHD